MVTRELELIQLQLPEAPWVGLIRRPKILNLALLIQWPNLPCSPILTNFDINITNLYLLSDYFRLQNQIWDAKRICSIYAPTNVADSIYFKTFSHFTPNEKSMPLCAAD